MLGLGDIVSVVLFQFLSVLLMYSIQYHIGIVMVYPVSAKMKLFAFHIIQVLPGLLLCFAMRFDSLCQPAGSGTAIANGSITRLRMCFQRWSYFSTALFGYAVG